MKILLRVIALFLVLSACQRDNEMTDPSETQLAKYLNKIHADDQNNRILAISIEKKYGRKSMPMLHLQTVVAQQDAINTLKVQHILDEYGWVGPRKIGREANATLFLVIQHSKPEIQRKYLPMMREAVKNKNAMTDQLALLEDRVAIHNGEKQIYGSQIGVDDSTGAHFVLPMIEPEKVNERRATMLLGPMEEYVAVFGIEWSVENYEVMLEKCHMNLDAIRKK